MSAERLSMDAQTGCPKLRIAFIDDEPWVLLGMRDIIPWEDYGFARAYAFGSAEEALPALRRDPVDAVITDIRLPEMSGLDLTAILLRERLAQVVVIVSAYRDFEYAKRAISEGVAYYLLKPLDREEVQRVAERMARSLRGGQAAPAPLRLGADGAVPADAEAARLLKEAAAYPNCYLQLDALIVPGADARFTRVVLSGYPRAALVSRKRPLDAPALAPGVSRCHPDFEDTGALLREAQASRALCFRYCPHPTVSGIQFYIATHYDRKLLNSDLARDFYMSEVYMSECFKRYTGMTVGAFVIHVRMQRAMYLLTETDLSIREVAESVGYPDAGYFGRLFRKKIGVSPERYRRGA